VAGRLDGEVALVTGSTSGLGAEIARLFGAEGAAVVVTGRDRGRGEAVVAEMAAEGGRGHFAVADLRAEEACAALVDEAVDTFGSLTVLVNNAVRSGAGDGPVTDVDAETWREVLEVNLVAAASCCRFAVPRMREAGHGSIVNVSSRAAARGTPGLAAYTASKGALEALTRSITADFAREGIRANTLQPGYVLHERRDASMTAERRARVEGMHLTRLATATDVAYAALYLASRESETVAGTTLRVDGGSAAVRGLTLG